MNVFEDLEPISRNEIEQALSSPDARVVTNALIRMSLFEEDRQWAEELSVRSLSDSRKAVKTAALTSIGHLARRFHEVRLDVVLPAITELVADPDCGDVAEDALDDIRMFVPGAS